MTLAQLRQKASASYSYRSKSGAVITEAQYDAMPSETKEQQAAKAKFQWRPDPKSVDALVSAERAVGPRKAATA